MLQSSLCYIKYPFAHNTISRRTCPTPSLTPHLVAPWAHHVIAAHMRRNVQVLSCHRVAFDVGVQTRVTLNELLFLRAPAGVRAVVLNAHGGWGAVSCGVVGNKAQGMCLP